MKIRALIAFTDLQAKDPDDAEVPAGREMTVAAERGAELIRLKLAERVGTGASAAPSPAKD